MIEEDTARTGTSADTSPERAATTRLPGIDGLRAVAVAAVIAFHFSDQLLPGGFLGVDLFFVISGFVITRLLLVERERHGRIRLLDFWQRRARRLFPAVLVVHATVQAWLWIYRPQGLDEIVRDQSLSALFYVSNWYNIFADFGYWDADVSLSPLNHLWSLAIEEQFYLVWPLVLAVVTRRQLLLWLAGAGLVATAVFPVVMSGTWDVNRLYLGTDTRVAALLVGVLLAAVLVRVGEDGQVSSRTVTGRGTRILVTCLAGAATAFLVFGWTRFGLHTDLFRGQLLATTLVEGVLLITVVVHPTGWHDRLLRLRPLQWIGETSYSLYLWHWPVLVIVDQGATGLSTAPLTVLRLTIIVVLARLSYRFVENPVRHSPVFTGERLAALLLVSALVVGAASWRYQPATSEDMRQAKGAAPLVVQRKGGAKVLVVGDSWGRNLGIGMTAADTEKKTTVLNYAVGSCGIADPEAYRNGAGRTFTVPQICHGWQQRWRAAIEENKPDAVLMVIGHFDGFPSKVDGEWVQPCDDTFDANYARKLDEALELLSESGTKVLVTNTSDAGHKEATRMAGCITELIERAVERHRDATLLDLRGLLCPSVPCPVRMDGQEVYDVTGHLAPVWQKKAGAWALKQVYSHIKPAVDSDEAPAGSTKQSLLPLTLPSPEQAIAILGGDATPLRTDIASVAREISGGKITEADLSGREVAANAYERGSATIRAAVATYTEDRAPERVGATILRQAATTDLSLMWTNETGLTSLYSGDVDGRRRDVIVVRQPAKVAFVLVDGAPDSSAPAITELAERMDVGLLLTE